MENMPLTTKGHVKLELYNEKGTFLTKEKHNLVVQSANEIVANILADPAKKVRVDQKDKGETLLTAEVEGYPFDLTIQHLKRVNYRNDLGSSNTDTLIIVDELKGIQRIEKVVVGSEALSLNKDVKVVDADNGRIEFATAPTEAFQIIALVMNDEYVKAVDSTETVKVGGDLYTRSDKASDADKTYVFNPELGQVFFETRKEKVEVSYKYDIAYSVGFMSLGGKPNGWADGKPLTFGNSDKLKTEIGTAELPDARVRVQFPCEIEAGSKEIDPSIPTQPVETTVLSETNRITTQSDGQTKVLEYDFSNVYTNGSVSTACPMLELLTVTNMTSGLDLKSNTTVVKSDETGITLKFRDEDVAAGDFVKATYRVKISNKHLTYQLSQAPVIKLINVRHIDSLDPTKMFDYNIVKNGLQTGYGDVWISNPATGHIQFAENPTGGPVPETPGHLQVTYQINSGTTVKFVADFPKGVPGPVEKTTVYTQTLAPGQGGNVVLPKPIATDENGNVKPIQVTMGTNTLTTANYTISNDNKTVILSTPQTGQVVTVTYPYAEDTHDIYQVAMFDNKVGGKMFNISGIGPITKDSNTGMRITWSVTL